MVSALVLGEICLDIIMTNPKTVPVLATPVWAEKIGFRLGGSAVYVAQGLCALGGRVALHSSIGTEKILDEFLVPLSKEGIELNLLQRCGEINTPICIGVVEEGKKHFVGCSPLSPYPVEDLDKLDVSNYDLIYFGGYLLYPEVWDGKLTRFFRRCHPGTLKVIDTQMLPIPINKYRHLAVYPGAFEDVDTLLVDRKEAIALAKTRNMEEAACRLSEYGAKIVVIKLGAEGCLVYKEGGYWLSHPPVVQAYDLIGTGDLFGAAFSYGLIQDWQLDQVANFANTFAALGAARKNGQSLPTIKQVLEAMNRK